MFLTAKVLKKINIGSINKKELTKGETLLNMPPQYAGIAQLVEQLTCNQ